MRCMINEGDDNDGDNDDGDNGAMISRSCLEHVLVLGDGEVDGVEDGAVLVKGPGVDIDEVGDFLPVPPGVNGSLTHHGRGIAEGPTSGGTEQEYYQVPEQDQTNSNQKNGANGNQIQVRDCVLNTGFHGLQIEVSALGIGSDEGGKGSNDGHGVRRHVGLGIDYPGRVAAEGVTQIMFE